jgi:CRISPR-associated Csx2 family protein
MWDVFGLDMAGDDETAFAGVADLNLEEAVRREAVTQAMLDVLAPMLSARIGCLVVLRLIGFARNAAEQTEVLHTMAEQIEPHQHIALDVTHSFRHLPMLALVAARYLKHTRNAQVQAIYYGALDMTVAGQPTPVLNLQGMLTMLDWVDGLSVYQHTGDYGIFTDLMQTAGMAADKAQQWRQAAFHERTMGAEIAYSKLNDAHNAMHGLSDPLLDLFKPELNQRMQWARQPNRALREHALAEGYLKRKDHLRGVFYLYECLLTHEVERHSARYAGLPAFEARKSAAQSLKEQYYPHFGQLEYLRNTLAHGVRSDDQQVRKALKEEAEMERSLGELRRALKDALPKKP